MHFARAALMLFQQYDFQAISCQCGFILIFIVHLDNHLKNYIMEINISRKGNLRHILQTCRAASPRRKVIKRHCSGDRNVIQNLAVCSDNLSAA